MISNTKTSIVNMALDLLEEEPILTLDDDRTAARWMNRNYDPVCEALIRQHPWNWAIKRAALAASATEPEWGWDYAFALPSDCVRMLPLEHPDGYALDHVIEDGHLLTDSAGPLYVRYIYRASESRFDPMFVQALAAALAWRAASLVTGKQSYAERLSVIARDTMQQAQMADALEGTPEKPSSNYLVNGRFTGVID